eukprot:2509581-Pleurochrysis_carterae.AAC.1
MREQYPLYRTYPLAPDHPARCQVNAAAAIAMTMPFLEEKYQKHLQGIYFKGIGQELVRNHIDGDAEVVSRFDLFVSNLSFYRPKDVGNNGKRGELGDFGTINLADGESCNFEFAFINSETGMHFEGCL